MVNANNLIRLATSVSFAVLAAVLLAAPAPASAQAVLSVNLNGAGIVGSSPAGISCNVLVTSCQATFASGSTVIVTVQPTDANVFTGWSGACSGTGGCQVVMNGNQSVTASFANGGPQYPLIVSLNRAGQVSSNPGGLVCNALTPGCSGEFAAGTSVTLIATPAQGLRFAGWSGACSGAGTCVVAMTAAESVTANFGTACAFSPEAGWWWNPAAAGRGYFIDYQAGPMYFVAFAYDNAGGAPWYAASGDVAPNPAGTGSCTFAGTLQTYGGGQTLAGAYRSPTSTATLGPVSITFTDATHASATLPGETVALQRYIYAGNGSATPEGPADPRTGIYLNPAEGGRGFGIEVQNGVLYMVSWMYDGSGNPVWYASAPGLDSAAAERAQPRDRCCGPGYIPPPPPYFGQWVEYANGQTIGGPYRSPSVANPDAGSVTMQFAAQNAAAGTLTLPNGVQIPLQRYIQ
jgi:List-Bact-rpt repeat protein